MIKNSDFAITITGTEESNLGEGATADDYDSTVRISYNKGNRKVDPVEIRLSDYGKNITYVFALEAGTESGFAYSFREDYMQDEVQGKINKHNRIAYHVSTWGENDRYIFADDLYDRLINSEGTIEPIIDHFGNTITTIEVKHD